MREKLNQVNMSSSCSYKTSAPGLVQTPKSSIISRWKEDTQNSLRGHILQRALIIGQFFLFKSEQLEIAGVFFSCFVFNTDNEESSANIACLL